MRRGRGVLLVLALVLGACSGDGDGDDVGDDEATTTTAEPTSTTIRPTPYAGYESETYADPAHWVCRGDVDDDPCDVEMDATVVEADGSTAPDPYEPATDPAVDCFYVYPTISRDERVSSDLVPAEGEEVLVTRNQAARLGEVCRVFAPVYRQTTLTALVARMTGAEPPAGGGDSRQLAYDDVLDAWKHYVANDNEGRGVVLIGHSQGAGLLNRLLQEEVDGDDDARALLVSAMLLGASVAVPEGADVGGDLQEIPLCRARDQVGCVISYASFRETAPPPEGTFFGRVDEGRAACTNPAALEGGRGELRPYFASVDQSILGGEPTPVEWATGVTVDTPFVTLPGLLTAECVEAGGVSYLSIRVEGDPADPRIDDIRGDLTPEWGLHLVDVNVAMGDLVDIAAEQAEAYAAG